MSACLRRIFFSSRGLRPGWRALLFLALLVAAGFVIGAPTGSFLRKHQHEPLWSLAGRLLTIVMVAIPGWIMARFVDFRPFTDFGLSTRGAVPRLTAGLIAGFVSLSLLLVMIRLTGYFRFGGLALHDSGSIANYALYYAAMFICVALMEELLTRGYLLFVISEGIGFWAAAILLAAAFAAGHLRNAGENMFGIANAMAVAIFLGWTVRRTGSLWWAIGYHMTWDWAETYFYGVPDSGFVAPGHLLNGTLSGPAWVSGGSAGPEGSIFVLVIIAVLAASVWALFPPTPPPGLGRPAEAPPLT